MPADGAGPSAGEVLGCTAPVVASDTEAIVFVADGRFHLEAIMIANPSIPAFRCGVFCCPRPTCGFFRCFQQPCSTWLATLHITSKKSYAAHKLSPLRAGG